MKGNELRTKMENAGYTQIEIARLLGVAPQSITQYYNADDVKTGLLEKLCQVLEKDMSFFYGDSVQSNSEVLQAELADLRKENSRLKSELTRIKDPNLKDKSERIYNIWMKFMDVTEEMQELYKENKEE